MRRQNFAHHASRLRGRSNAASSASLFVRHRWCLVAVLVCLWFLLVLTAVRRSSTAMRHVSSGPHSDSIMPPPQQQRDGTRNVLLDEFRTSSLVAWSLEVPSLSGDDGAARHTCGMQEPQGQEALANVQRWWWRRWTDAATANPAPMHDGDDALSYGTHACTDALVDAMVAAPPPDVAAFDVVMTHVNGSVLAFQARWRAAFARHAPTADTKQASSEGETIVRLDALHKAAVDAGDRLEAARLLKVMANIKGNQQHASFPQERFRDWGEVAVAMSSIAQCATYRKKRRSAPGGGANGQRKNALQHQWLPLSGVLHLVVSHEDQIPTFLIPRTPRRSVDGTADRWYDFHSNCTASAEDAAFTAHALGVHVVFHTDLLPLGKDNTTTTTTTTASDDATMSNVNEMYNSNAIESLLHRIPGVSQQFLYANNDMVFGRCPTWGDYFHIHSLAPTAARRGHSMVSNRQNSSWQQWTMALAPIVFGEALVEQHDGNDGVSGGGGGAALRRRRQVRYAFQRPATGEARFLDAQAAHLRTLLMPQLGSDTAAKDDGRNLIRLAFAHHPRLYSRALLSWVLDESPLAPASVATRTRWFERHSNDIWVPLLMDHVLLFALNNNNNVSRGKPGGGDDGRCADAYCCLEAFPSSLPLAPSPPSVLSPSCLGFVSLRGHSEYYFVMLDGASRIRRAFLELESHAENHGALPLFITLNDDLASVTMSAEGLQGSGLAKMQQDMNGLLSMIVRQLYRGCA